MRQAVGDHEENRGVDVGLASQSFPYLDLFFVFLGRFVCLLDATSDVNELSCTTHNGLTRKQNTKSEM